MHLVLQNSQRSGGREGKGEGDRERKRESETETEKLWENKLQNLMRRRLSIVGTKNTYLLTVALTKDTFPLANQLAYIVRKHTSLLYKL